MTNLEGRIIRLELLLQATQDYLRKLEGRVASTEQQARQPLAQMWNPGGGGGGIAYWTKSPHGGVAASTGDWPDIVPSTWTEDVYRDVGGTLTLEASAATIRWFYRDTDEGDSLIPVQPNGDGSYDALASSCTAVVS